MSEPLIHDPGDQDRIDHVYLFLSIDDQGNNAIVGWGLTPLVTDCLHTAETMKQLAQRFAANSGKTVGMFAFRRETQLWQAE